MHSPFYEATTLWVLFIVFVMILALLRLYQLGKASNSVMLIATVVGVIFISLIHWTFGAQNFLWPNIPSGIFFIIILVGAFLI